MKREIGYEGTDAGGDPLKVVNLAKLEMTSARYTDVTQFGENPQRGATMLEGMPAEERGQRLLDLSQVGTEGLTEQRNENVAGNVLREMRSAFVAEALKTLEPEQRASVLECLGPGGPAARIVNVMEGESVAGIFRTMSLERVVEYLQAGREGMYANAISPLKTGEILDDLSTERVKGVLKIALASETGARWAANGFANLSNKRWSDLYIRELEPEMIGRLLGAGVLEDGLWMLFGPGGEERNAVILGAMDAKTAGLFYASALVGRNSSTVPVELLRHIEVSKAVEIIQEADKIREEVNGRQSVEEEKMPLVSSLVFGVMDKMDGEKSAAIRVELERRVSREA